MGTMFGLPNMIAASSPGISNIRLLLSPAIRSRALACSISREADVSKKGYDVYCFEELPLYLRWEIIDNHRIIWSRDKGDLYEYFYYFRKLQAEQKHRMELTRKDVLGMLRASVARG